jgi:hypothetical protein
MKSTAKLLLLVCVCLATAPCYARSKKTKLYRNEALNFCVYVPADWRGPAEVKNHAGAAFGAPTDPVRITIGVLSNQPRSIILQRPDAGSQMATLDDYRGATLKEWKTDSHLTKVKQKAEDSATLQQVPALHTVLTYQRDGERRRYEAVFALWHQTQYSIEYDAPSGLAKRYEKKFQDVLRTFEFQCAENEQR